MLYIHQYPDWTNFRYDQKRILSALGKVRLEEGLLLGQIKLLNVPSTLNKILIQDIKANYAIDGKNIDASELKKFGSKAGTVSPELKNLFGSYTNAGQPLTKERLLNWHAAIGQNQALKFREKENVVEHGNDKFEGAAPYRIEAEIENFINWFENSDEDGLLKAILAQFWFLSIRPFEDGNGRIARMISAMAMARCEKNDCCQYSINSEILSHREEYLQTLSKCQKGNGDLTEWILFFLQLMQNAFEKSRELLASEIATVRYRAGHACKPASPRMEKLFEAIFSGKLKKTFTVKEFAALAETSHDTALRDVQSLMEQGLIRQEKKGGRSTCYSLVD